MPEVVLRTEGLTKRYGTLTAVDGLTLDVHEGEILGFLGPNGAGKTTSINMMCGLLRPDAGWVTIRGVPVANSTGANVPAAGLPRDGPIHARVGMCPQEIVLWERLTCLEQLQFIGQMYGLQGGEARKRGERLLYELGLADKRKVQARRLSGGMQRRLNLAMALVHDPEIVVLDEPEAGLDPQSRVKVREYIRSLARAKTVILTTHNMDEADRVADRVAIIDQGRLLVLDTPQALKQQVGEGDVVEIGLDGPVADGLEAALQAVSLPSGRPAVSEVRLGVGERLLTVRALNAVGALPAILGTLAACGQRPTDLRLRENTLEDVFIQLTGRRLRE